MIAGEFGSMQREADSDLDVCLDLPLPATLPVDSVSAAVCVGTCFHRRSTVRDLRISVDGVGHRAAATQMPRLDLFRSLHPSLPPEEWPTVARDSSSERDPELRAYRSGFWATIPIGPRTEPGEVRLAAVAKLGDGRSVTAPLGTVTAVAPPERLSIASPRRKGSSLIAVCMTTFNPDLRLFRTQVESLREQTDPDWVCLISDDCSDPGRFEGISEVVGGDDRFVMTRAPERLGFYRNFERILGLVPDEADLVALCDHDDRWFPEKLATLRAAIGDAELVYSDLRLVDADGRVRADTLWRGRSNNHENLASLLISNSIVGASCLFSRRAVDRALPFPRSPGWDFHDHWLALVALSLGDVAYVDRPLYDYVQHPGAVLGRVASEPEEAEPARRRGLPGLLGRRRGLLTRWRAAYFTAYLQRALHARVLLARCSTDLSPSKRRALRLLAAADRSPIAFAWLAVRPLRALTGANETLGMERILLRGILWRHLIRLRARRRPRPDASDDASVPSFDPRPLGGSRRRWLANR